jgi:predicted acylesterase/phospholipase RssA/CRP-like cAMP-binding protein
VGTAVETDVDALAGAPLFAGLDRERLEELAAACRPLTLRAGEWLFRTGEEADRLYVIRSGRLRVVAGDPDDALDEPRVVRELGAGAALGELALLTGAPRSASVQAARDSQLLELEADRFVAALADDPSFALEVARELARQLQHSGGIEPPAARPSVLAVAAASAGAPVRQVAEELQRSLGAIARVVVDDGRGTSAGGYAALLERLERDAAVVVLVDDGDPDWSAFCRRQADRLLAVATGAPGPEPVDRSLYGCDAILVAARAGQVAVWLERLHAQRHHHVDPDDFGGGVARVARRLAGRSLGLVLSGGGARAYAHIGVLDVLRREGFEIDRVGGASFGALIGAMAALGWGAEEMRTRCAEHIARRSPFRDYTVPRIALIRARKAAAMLERLFADARVEETPRSFYAVSADLLSSSLVVHRDGRLVDAVGASMSIPGLAPPMPFGGALLVDGGILNNLPVDLMAETDEGPVVAVDVMRRLDPAEPGAAPRFPSILETLSRATVLGSVERAETNRRLAQLLVTPDVQDIALRQFSALDRAIDAGRRGAEEALAGEGGSALREALAARA